MTKLESRSPTLTYSPATLSTLEPEHRLIVLFPASEMDSSNLSHRIWEIATSFHLNVVFLSLCNDFAEETQLRRKLVTLASLVKDVNLSTEIMIEQGNDWVGRVKYIWKPGDIVACYAGQRVGLMHRPLEEALRSSLETQIYFLSEYHPVSNPTSTFLSQISSWLGSFAIIGGFFWAEVKVVQLPQDWAHTALLYLYVLVEIILIWAWNSIFA
jgi:hypothetical protein